MKKYFYILLIFYASFCQAQNDQLKLTNLKTIENHRYSFLVLALDTNGNGIYLTPDSNTKSISNSIAHPLKPNTKFVYLNSAKKIRLSSATIPLSLKDYRYTVTDEYGMNIGPANQTPKPLKNRGDEITDFGLYSIENKSLIFTIYKLGDNNSKTQLVICNNPPKKIELVGATLQKVYNPAKVIRVERNSHGDTVLMEKATSEGLSMDINGRQIPFDKNRSYAEFTVKAIDNIFLYSVIIKRLDKSGLFIISDNYINWSYDDFGHLRTQLPIKDFELPGKYEVIIYPKIGDVDVKNIKNGIHIKFEIISPKFFDSMRNVILFGISLFVLALLIFGAIFLRIKITNKRKLKFTEQQKEVVKLQLNAVRSQLNPHFLFNALSGIQNLMNKNEIDNANKYLAKFARLTRNVLDEKELISLAQEKTLLDDYLQMEQLRFGFSYEIKADDGLDLENLEIPSMLLQPFVENSVKHGIASINVEGKIEIAFSKNGNNLVLTVADNGKGFNTDKKHEGLGLSLSKNRISLLNSIYKENQLILSINSNQQGTSTILTLKDWL